jgi:peroxiredoxin
MSIVRHALRAALVALVALACAGPSLAELAVGQSVPDFTLRDLDGNELSLASLRGKTVVLEWINPNCPFSLRHSQEKTMQSTADKHPGVAWLGINSTNPTHRDHLEPAAYKAFLAEHGIRYPVLDDGPGDVGRAYGAKTTPHMYVIDPEGRLVYSGAIDDDPRGGKSDRVNYVDAALTAMAEGKSPDPASTRPYGCSVKY